MTNGNLAVNIIAKNPPMALIGVGAIFALVQAFSPNEVTAWWGWVLVAGILLQVIYLVSLSQRKRRRGR